MAQDDRYAEIIERVDRDLLIPAAPDEVWEVITHDGWLAEWVDIELTPGGDVRFTDRDEVRTGWVEEATPPEAERPGLLVFWWGPESEPATRVELALEPESEGTRLRVAETRPLEVLDVVGLPLPGQVGRSHGPAMLALA